MSYLEEWDRIDKMIENHNISKSTVITSEKRQALALSHIAKCLSVFADDITGAHESVDSIRRCGECVHQGDTEHCASCQIIFNVTGFEKKIEEARDEKEEIEVRCPSCGEIITAIKFKEDILNLKCPTCGTDFTYNISTNVREWRI